MARPLPKTNAPALAKNHKIWPSTSGVATTTKHAGAERFNQAGGACTTMAARPHSRKSHRISVSVHAVTIAMRAKMTHCRRSFAIVSLASLYAAMVMMPMTTAPTP